MEELTTFNIAQYVGTADNIELENVLYLKVINESDFICVISEIDVLPHQEKEIIPADGWNIPRISLSVRFRFEYNGPNEDAVREMTNILSKNAKFKLIYKKAFSK